MPCLSPRCPALLSTPSLSRGNTIAGVVGSVFEISTLFLTLAQRICSLLPLWWVSNFQPESKMYGNGIFKFVFYKSRLSSTSVRGWTDWDHCRTARGSSSAGPAEAVLQLCKADNKVGVGEGVRWWTEERILLYVGFTRAVCRETWEIRKTWTSCTRHFCH